MELNKSLHDRLKERSISVLQVHRILSEAGFEISKRTLHSWLDKGMRNCSDENIEKAIKKIIHNYDDLISKIKNI